MQLPPGIEFKIRTEENGQVNISGPLNDYLLCRLLLIIGEKELEEVRAAPHRAQKTGSIIPASADALSALRN